MCFSGGIKIKKGKQQRVVLAPKQAYGEIISDKFRTFPLAAIPVETRQVGRKVMAVGKTGQEELVEVTSVDAAKVVLNFNHVLAGQTLQFDVKLLTKKPL